MSQLRKTISPPAGVSAPDRALATHIQLLTELGARHNLSIVDSNNACRPQPEPARKSDGHPLLIKLLTLRIHSFIFSHRLTEKQMEPAETRARRTLREGTYSWTAIKTNSGALFSPTR